MPGVADAAGEGLVDTTHLSDPFLGRIKQVPVKKAILKNGSHYPIEAEALADLHRYSLEFIHEQLNR